MSQCEYAGCGAAAEYRVIEAGEEADVCTQHVGPVLSGDAIARVYPLSLTEDGASNVVHIRRPNPTPGFGHMIRFSLFSQHQRRAA
jgi:hypothetical protein